MKSKKILFIIILFALALNQAEYAQEITEEQKQQYILNLADSTKSWDAILSVVKYKVTEAIPTIIEQIWNKGSYEQILFLKALYYLNSDRAKQFIYQYLSRVDNYDLTDKTIKAISLKGDAASILVNLGDFSQRQFIYDDIENKHPEEFPEQIFTLFRILENYPPDKEKATNLLKKIAEDSPNPINRGYVIGELYEFYGDEIIPFVIERFEVEGTKDDSLRADSAFPRIFSKTRSEIVHQFLRNYLIKDRNTGIGVANILIGNWGTPKDYKIVKNKLERIYDEDDKEFLASRLGAEVVVKKHVSEMLNTTQIVDTLLSYQNQCLELNWLGDVAFSEQLKPYLLDAKTKLISGDSFGAAIKIKQYQTVVFQARKDSIANRFVTVDGYKFLYYYPEYILERLPKLPTTKLEDSQGKLLNGGTLQYYEGAWKEAINNNDGTFTVPTTLKTVSLRMNYAYGSQTKSNVTVGADTVVFQTVSAQVKLINSFGAAIDTGKVQYYAGAWREFGSTANGIASKELLAGNYSFRITYAFASKDKAQDVGAYPIVVFQTVPATVQLKNSQGNLIDQGAIQYYSEAWRDFGVTANGIAVKELLPNNYSFRMNYAFASKDKAQDIGVNPNIVFQTVPATVQLKNSLGNLIDQGTVQYYSGAWRDFGITTNGAVVKELLPNNYSFRMNYAFASKDKAQDVGVNSTVVFQTVNTVVQLKNTLGNFIDQGVAQYYSGAWRSFGSTTNGIASLELLPNNYSFRMTYEFISNDKVQDVGLNSTVSFSTVLCRVNVKNAQNQPVDNARISYYSGAWRLIGNTVNGTITKELLPSNLQFRLNYGITQRDKTQNILTNNIVEFGL